MNGRIRIGMVGLVTAGAAVLGTAQPAPAVGCQVCVSFVTTYDDGPGGLPGKTRMHRDLAPNAAYALDVDGDLPPLPLGALGLVPGYEVRANVQALDAARPRIVIERLPAAPLPELPLTPLPLRIELVTGDAAGWTSLGYDALGANAPQKFAASVDLTNRDGSADTEQAYLDAAITTPGKSLALVTESFAGDPAGARSGRRAVRLDYSRVPASVTADVTTPAPGAPARRHVVLTRDSVTRPRLDFSVSAPDSVTKGTVDELPQRVDVGIATTRKGVDTTGDGAADFTGDELAIDYTHATAVAKSFVIDTVQAGSHTHADITDFPRDAHLTYVNAAPVRNPKVPLTSGPLTRVTYGADSRATRADLDFESAASGTVTRLGADVRNVPRTIHEISHRASVLTRNERIAFRSDARADHAVLTYNKTASGDEKTDAVLEVAKPPSGVTLDYESGADSGRVHYAAPEKAERADLALRDDEGRTTVVGVEQIPTDVLASFTKRGSGDFLFDYTADAVVPEFELHGRHYTNLPEGAGTLDVRFEDIPQRVMFNRTDDVVVTERKKEIPPPDRCLEDNPPPTCPTGPRYEVTTTSTADASTDVLIPTGQLGLADIHITSGPEARLPERAANDRLQDGLLVRDLHDSYLAHLRLALVRGFKRSEHDVSSKTVSPIAPTKFDSFGNERTEYSSGAHTHAFGLDLRSQPQAGGDIMRTDLMLATLPGSVALDKTHNTTFGNETTTWTASGPVAGYAKGPAFSMTTGSQPAGKEGVDVSNRVTLDPMPASFHVCQADDDLCGTHRFDAGLRHLDNGDRGSMRTFSCALAGCLGEQFDVVPGQANRGSIGMRASEPTHLVFEDGDASLRFKPFVDVDLQHLTDLAIQGHKESVVCLEGAWECQRGYIALDASGGLSGQIHKGGGDAPPVLLDFPQGFTSNDYVWAFHETGPLSGRLGSTGQLHCPGVGDPGGTRMLFGGEDVSERFCNGDVLEGNIFDQLPGM